MKFRFVHRLSDINPCDWDRLPRDNYPFLSHAFLNALEESGSVSAESGWQPMHLIGENQGELVLTMPLYIKEHSYGEYVFDWQWARAFEQHGRRYFPKLLSAIPFTPALGPRILTKNPLDADTLGKVLETLKGFADKSAMSSWHLLFPDEPLHKLAEKHKELMLREDVQFHWKNHGYVSFDAFLDTLKSSKRKQIRRERRKVQEQGVRLVQKSGEGLEATDWQNFYHAYRATYYKRSGHAGYLNKAFFDQIAETMSNQVMLVNAYLEYESIASALFFFDEKHLYGRYWGSLNEVDCLHFEACYYQGIDFAISRGIETFNPGTQGEHKLVRGFEPTKTQSYHWIADAEFAAAISDYLARERTSIDHYKQAAGDYLPYKKDESDRS